MTFRSFGGPTVEFTFGGLTFLTDPTFDEPGDYPIGSRKLTKTAPPSGEPGPVDVVLLSHDQHPDNLDHRGREVALGAPLVLSTPAAASRLGPPVQGLSPWASLAVADGVRVTAVPADHGPEHLVGPVIGFVVEGGDSPTVYVSGDNASLAVVSEIAARFPAVEVAVLFGGAARTALVGDTNLTLSAEEMVEAARILGVSTVVPAHVDSWAHFTESGADVRAAFDKAGLLSLLPGSKSPTSR